MSCVCVLTEVDMSWCQRLLFRCCCRIWMQGAPLATFPIPPKTSRSLCIAQHHRGWQSNVASPVTKRAWTVACTRPTSCTWSGMTGRGWVTLGGCGGVVCLMCCLLAEFQGVAFWALPAVILCQINLYSLVRVQHKWTAFKRYPSEIFLKQKKLLPCRREYYFDASLEKASLRCVLIFSFKYTTFIS